MNEAKKSSLDEILEQIKQEDIHFASELLTKLAGHVSEQLKTNSPECPPGYIKNSQGQCVPDIGA